MKFIVRGRAIVGIEKEVEINEDYKELVEEFVTEECDGNEDEFDEQEFNEWVNQKVYDECHEWYLDIYINGTAGLDSGKVTDSGELEWYEVEQMEE